jgi:acyl-CoA synthetase (AMP-forming)/AMP-acid ligase II
MTDHDAHLGRIDKDSFIHVPGRATDLIIRGGNNIDPVVIEHALRAHPEVTAANAVGRPRPRFEGSARGLHHRPGWLNQHR